MSALPPPSSPPPPSAAGRYRAFLFDMDGTVINSIAAAERIWGTWAQRQGLDVAAFLPTIHGARSVDTIAQLRLPGVDAQRESQGITDAEIVDVEDHESRARCAFAVAAAGPVGHRHLGARALATAA